jgi:hypothetical protein
MNINRITEGLGNAQERVSNLTNNVRSTITDAPARLRDARDAMVDNVTNAKEWASTNLDIKHYIIIALIIAFILYKIRQNKNYNKKNPKFFLTPINARKPAIINRKDMKSMIGAPEYTYTMWLYVDNLNHNYNCYKHIFTRGDITYFTNVNKVNPGAAAAAGASPTQADIDNKHMWGPAAPGIWIDKIKNNIIFKISTTKPDDPTQLNPAPVPAIPINERNTGEHSCVMGRSGVNEGKSISEFEQCNNGIPSANPPSWGCDCFIIEDFPLRKWFCIGVVIKEREAELYFNGQLTFTGSLDGPPKVVDGNIAIAGIGDKNAHLLNQESISGWAGGITNVGIYTYPLTPVEMKKIYYNGHNNIPYYFSWFYYIFSPINYLFNKAKHKALLMGIDALKEETTDINSLVPATARPDLGKALDDIPTIGLYKIGDRIYIDDPSDPSNKVAGYIKDNPIKDPTSPATGEITYNIMLETPNVDGNADIVQNVKQSKIQGQLNSSVSYSRIFTLIITFVILIIIYVVYKNYT